MEELEDFLEWLDHQSLSICEPEMDRGQFTGLYEPVNNGEILQRYIKEA